jgi:hypothetical protein
MPMLRTPADPFLQNVGTPHMAILNVLGVPMQFAANECWLLELAQEAFADLPVDEVRRPSSDMPLVRMIANGDLSAEAFDTPPTPLSYGNDTTVVMALTNADLACINLCAEQAVITVSPTLARFPYNIRYELIEFAAYRLAAHCLGAVGMHAACVANGNATLLFFGESGAGKSTLVFSLMQQGWDLIGEDGVFVLPDRHFALRGAPNFIHLIDDQKASLDVQKVQSQRIQRRSGRVKLEVDARQLTQQPRIAASLGQLVFLDAQDTGAQHQLQKLDRNHVQQLLPMLQPFASGHPKWPEVQSALLGQPAWVLGRGNLQTSVALLMALVRDT